ncbi:MAG TPA: hypothetical protein VGP82_14300 [Ktedonobacterales bacterium]|nr:hypothetical protein [Ktedonobacterales bacterium]
MPDVPSAARTVAAADAPPAPGIWKRPRLAHTIWWLVIAVDALFFIAGVPGLYVALHNPCTDLSVECSAVQAPLADFQVMQQRGQVETSAIFVLTVVVLASLVFFAVGGLIAWRKWSDPMGLFVSAVLITFGATGISDALQVPAVPPLDWLNPILGPFATIFTLLQYPALATFLLTFPNGRFAPRWSWLLVLLWIVQIGLFFAGLPDGVLLLSVIVTWGSAAAVQFYRYSRVYTPAERQQTKWVVFSLAFIAIPSQIVNTLLPVIWPELNTPGSLYRLSSVLGLALFWMPISLGVGIAILRSRLYDIDLLINRALVYGSLTVILTAIYAVGVIGSQTAVGGLTHSSSEPQSPLTIVITTLVIAALFQPLRRRLQEFIDQRFYRTKYDAARTLAAFTATLREEVDLKDLADHLLSAVDETMQPAQVSLWLRASERAPNSRIDSNATETRGGYAHE